MFIYQVTNVQIAKQIFKPRRTLPHTRTQLHIRVLWFGLGTIPSKHSSTRTVRTHCPSRKYAGTMFRRARALEREMVYTKNV